MSTFTQETIARHSARRAIGVQYDNDLDMTLALDVIWWTLEVKGSHDEQ